MEYAKFCFHRQHRSCLSSPGSDDDGGRTASMAMQKNIFLHALFFPTHKKRGCLCGWISHGTPSVETPALSYISLISSLLPFFGWCIRRRCHLPSLKVLCWNCFRFSSWSRRSFCRACHQLEEHRSQVGCTALHALTCLEEVLTGGGGGDEPGLYFKFNQHFHKDNRMPGDISPDCLRGQTKEEKPIRTKNLVWSWNPNPALEKKEPERASKCLRLRKAPSISSSAFVCYAPRARIRFILIVNIVQYQCLIYTE